MTGLDRKQTPKTRPMPQKRTALVASLDIGTSKIACMIARLKPCPPSDALLGRSHAVAWRGDGHTVLHALPVGYALDGVNGIRDPRGMVARQFGVDMNVVTSDATVAKNLMLVVERCHLNVEAMAASPYVAGLSVLTDDEADLGAAVVEMGAGSTTIATYSAGRFVHSSGFALGGQHVTMDLARGVGACIADAERIKTLYGTVLTGGSDARELMSVPTAGEEHDAPQIVSRATIANIVRHRAEEIFEMVRDRLADSPFA